MLPTGGGACDLHTHAPEDHAQPQNLDQAVSRTAGTSDTACGRSNAQQGIRMSEEPALIRPNPSTCRHTLRPGPITCSMWYTALPHTGHEGDPPNDMLCDEVAAGDRNDEEEAEGENWREM